MYFEKFRKAFTERVDKYSGFLCRFHKETKIYIHQSKTTTKGKTSKRVVWNRNSKEYFIARSLPQEWKDTVTFLLIISYLYEEKCKLD